VQTDRNYDLEALKYSVKLLPTEEHPLQIIRKYENKENNNEQQENQNPDENQEKEENKIDPWTRLKQEIQKHSEQNIAADENIELFENTSDNIQKEIRAGRGKSRMGELENSAKKQENESTSITKSEYRKEMKILYDLLPKVFFCEFINIGLVMGRTKKS